MREKKIKKLIKRLEGKKADKEKMSISELCILDVHNVLEQQDKEISEGDIQFIRFMID